MIVNLQIGNINHSGYWNDWLKLIISELGSVGEYCGLEENWLRFNVQENPFVLCIILLTFEVTLSSSLQYWQTSPTDNLRRLRKYTIIFQLNWSKCPTGFHANSPVLLANQFACLCYDNMTLVHCMQWPVIVKVMRVLGPRVSVYWRIACAMLQLKQHYTQNYSGLLKGPIL